MSNDLTTRHSGCDSPPSPVPVLPSTPDSIVVDDSTTIHDDSEVEEVGEVTVQQQGESVGALAQEVGAPDSDSPPSPVTLLPRDSQESWIVDDEATVYDESEGEPVEGDVADQVRDHFPSPETDYFPPTREVMAAWEALPQPRDPHYRVVFECELEVLANANPTPVPSHVTRRGWRR